jgi:hypothetical protein
VHPTVLPSLLQITVVIQNVAGTENVGGALAAAVERAPDETLRLFGRPVKVTEACSASMAINYKGKDYIELRPPRDMVDAAVAEFNAEIRAVTDVGATEVA